MADDTFIFPGSKTNVTTTVNFEKDDVDQTVVKSSKFLRKLEEKAKDNIIAALKLDSNNFSGSCHIEYNMMYDSYMMKIIFNLNGNVIVVPYEFMSSEGIDIDEIIALVSLEIAKHVLRDTLTPILMNSPKLRDLVKREE